MFIGFKQTCRIFPRRIFVGYMYTVMNLNDLYMRETHRVYL